jgi:hypothetical protein
VTLSSVGAANPEGTDRQGRWRREIPTHLDVEDKAFCGLSVRQVLSLIGGVAACYGLWNQAAALPAALRFGLAAACLLLVAAIVLVRPGGRGLEEWAFVGLHFAAVPKAAVWLPRDPAAADWLPRAAHGARWAESPLCPPGTPRPANVSREEPQPWA